MKGRNLSSATKSLPVTGHGSLRIALGCGFALLMAACGTNLPTDNDPGRHIPAPADTTASPSGIPQVVTPLPLVEPPQPQVEPELYTIVAQDVPVRDLLFTMARDASINVDVHPSVNGLVSINAIDQTLPQILERIARQVDMRWRIDASGNVVVEADAPFWRNYTIDYVNVSRNSTTESLVRTSIAGGAGSTSTLNQATGNNFWTTLPLNLEALLNTSGVAPTGAAARVQRVIANPETGVVSVLGTARQQESIAAFIDSVQRRSLYQVLIEATVVEVRLSDNYQAGVDWNMLDRNNGEISFVQNLTDPQFRANPPASVLMIDRASTPDAIDATITMLSQFGELRVLSSPKLMTLNNQSGVLRVVNNVVYFTIDVEAPIISDNGITPAVYTSTATTVPVGFVMTVTPQISQDDQVTLFVRPSISRIVGYKTDPNPALQDAGITNEIPETQLSEMESVLKVFSGQVAILGGLMQDSIQNDQDGLPVLSRLPGVGGLFRYENERASKTELIVFIRPVVIRQPSLTGDLDAYRNYLPANGLEAQGPLLPEGVLSRPRGPGNE
jgi:MSHA biogenesis protein MshL